MIKTEEYKGDLTELEHKRTKREKTEFDVYDMNLWELRANGVIKLERGRTLWRLKKNQRRGV